jgi:hypothetical protein
MDPSGGKQIDSSERSPSLHRTRHFQKDAPTRLATGDQQICHQTGSHYRIQVDQGRQFGVQGMTAFWVCSVKNSELLTAPEQSFLIYLNTSVFCGIQDRHHPDNIQWPRENDLLAKSQIDIGGTRILP